MRVAAALALAFVVACSTAIPADNNGGPDANHGGGGPDAHGGGGPDAALPIDANNCPTQPCDIPTQCGCGPSQACDIDGTDLMGTACRAAGAGVIGSTCATVTDCAAGYVCVGDGTNDSCEQFCTGNGNCAAPRGQCVNQLVDQNSNPIAGAVTCTSNCDPSSVTNPVCPVGWGCDLFTATFNAQSYDIADCRASGAGGQGAACTTSTSCAAGYSCINNGTSNVCARICKPPSSSGCPGVTSCLSFTTPFTIGGTEYGVCL